MRQFFILCLIAYSNLVVAQDVHAFYVGHSLSDQIPDMVKSLAEDHSNTTFDWVYQSIPGAPLRWQWDRKDEQDYIPNPPHYYGFYDEYGGLPTGNFDALVLTESVPRYGSLIEETYEYADSFFVYSSVYNPQIKVYLYEDWHCILSGTPTECDYDVDSNPWRQRIDDDLPMWESVVDTLNSRFNPNDPVCLIPAAQGLAQVYDSIEVGAMPDLNAIEDLFSDNIHLNDIGKYFVACVHFSTIFETSPVGLTNQLQVWWGGDFDPPSPELALKFQEIAWQVATDYEHSCVGSVVNIQQAQNHQQNLKLYPNPVKNELFILTGSENSEIVLKSVICASSGQVILKSYSDHIDLSDLSSGLYYLVQEKEVAKFIKE